LLGEPPVESVMPAQIFGDEIAFLPFDSA